MMKRIFFLIILAAAAVCAKADGTSDARHILDKTASAVNVKKGVGADFVLSGERMHAKGTISLKANKFTAKTADVTVWFDGTTQWTYMASTDEVNISTPTHDQQVQMNPLTFLNLYKSGYKLTLRTLGSSYEVRMVAESKSNPVQEVYVVVDKKSYIPTQVRLRRKYTWMTINITNFHTLSGSDNIFIFNKKDYPTAEIVDLR